MNEHYAAINPTQSTQVTSKNVEKATTDSVVRTKNQSTMFQPPTTITAAMKQEDDITNKTTPNYSLLAAIANTQRFMASLEEGAEEKKRSEAEPEPAREKTESGAEPARNREKKKTTTNKLGSMREKDTSGKKVKVDAAKHEDWHLIDGFDTDEYVVV